MSVEISLEFKDHIDVFSESEVNELSSHRKSLDHFIDFFSDKMSFFDLIYNLFENELTLQKIYIDKNLINEFIARFKFSAYVFILFIKKRNEELKQCVNYRKLNVILVRNKYFISLIINILKRLKKVKIFIKLDIRETYNFISIKSKNEWKTVFRTRYENFEYRVLSFELITNSVTFQSYIDRALSRIYSNNVNDHNEHVKTILKTPRKLRLFVKLKKCSFEKN